ncbi:lipase 3-like isoform X2 [Haematobia irritans]|uniref:lipase 3-like isoform X2 n=1 Tax=Haematobia irritans TaxID=7368 RepID=UPI003F4F5862
MQVHLIFVVPLVFFGRWSIAIDTCDRITQHKYPCERHTLTTKDGYILTLFRIPQGAQGGYNSAHPANMTRDSRPVIMLLHGVECSSDSWIISGPENGLPFVLADAGYDVWLPNNRGNIYSERHVSLPSTSQAYWQFSIDEIGSIDVPTIIDFILAITKMQRLHFVGHSQGVTAFMMALASNPSYNRKISTSHLLGPAIFVCHARGPFPPILAPILGSTTGISKYLGNLPSGEINARLQGFLFALCQRENYENFCVQILNSFLGWDSPYLNRSIIGDIFHTHPAGCSTRQLIQFSQWFLSCQFNAYDFGNQGNLLKYGQLKPPSYNLANVNPQIPVDIYFSDNDFVVSPQDVYSLYKIVGQRATWNRVKYPKFNHMDFLWGTTPMKCITLCILSKIQKYENYSYTGRYCKCFKNKPF